MKININRIQHIKATPVGPARQHWGQQSRTHALPSNGATNNQGHNWASGVGGGGGKQSVGPVTMDRIGQRGDTVSGASNHGHIEQAWGTQAVSMDKIGQWWDTVSGASNHGHIEQAWRTQSVGLVTMDTLGKRGGQSVGPVTMDRMDTDTGAMPSPETWAPRHC